MPSPSLPVPLRASGRRPQRKATGTRRWSVCA